jgi:hypothetical protein
VILYGSTDRIKFQFADVDYSGSHDFGASASLVIENFGGAKGFQFSYNGSPSLSNGLTVELIPIRIACCDFNGDSKIGILWRSKTTDQHYVWFMNGINFASSTYRIRKPF